MSEFHIMFNPSMIEISEWNLESVTINETEIKNCKVSILPIEFGNKIEIKKDIPLCSFSIKEIVSVDFAKGENGKKKESRIKIMVGFDQNNKSSLFLKANNSTIEKIGNAITSAQKLQNDFWEIFELPYYRNDELMLSRHYFKTPYLADGEKILWQRTRTYGTIHKNIATIEVLTNFRAFLYDFKDHLWNICPLYLIDEVLVENVKRGSGNMISGNSVVKIEQGNFCVGTDERKNTAKSIGNVIFRNEDMLVYAFQHISYPHSLAQLARSVIKESKKAYMDYHLRQEKRTKTSSIPN